jgi:hypothetical protein
MPRGAPRARDIACMSLAAAGLLAGGPIALADPPLPSPAAADPVQEVTVRGTRVRDPGSETITASDAREVPGAFGDAFRAVDALPGVAPVVSGLPFFFVRGAPPGNVGSFIDGVRVPLLFHFALGPSVVHPALLDRVDFYPGGYPARFGRFAGAIVSGDLAPPQDRAHGEANVRAFDAGGLAEAPFDDGRGHALVAGRYGYPALVLPIFAPDTRLAYGDYQTRETFALTDRDTIGVFALGSYDNLEQRDSASSPFDEVLGMEFYRIDLRYDRALPNGGHARVAVTVGADTSRDDRTRVTDFTTSARSEIDAPIDAHLRVRGGSDVTLDHYGLDESSLDYATLLYPPRNDVEIGIWSDLVWRPAPGLEIVPGVRADLFDSKRLGSLPALLPPGFGAGQLNEFKDLADTAIPTVDPRLALRLAVTGDLTYVATFGVAHQRPSFFVPVPGLQLAQQSTSLQSSVQMSQGIEVALPAQVTAKLTGFVRDDAGLSDLSATCPSAEQVEDVRSLCAAALVRGRSFGAELFVRRSLSRRLTGWLSYTLSRSERQASDPAAGALPTWILSEFDRTHVLSVVAGYDLGDGWRAGARFYYDSGRPYSQTESGFPIPPFDDKRLPDFWRIDLRLEKQWRPSRSTRVSLVLEGMNVTLNKEATSAVCVPSSSSSLDACRPSYVGPIAVPSIGAEVFW